MNPSIMNVVIKNNDAKNSLVKIIDIIASIAINKNIANKNSIINLLSHNHELLHDTHNLT